MNDSMTKTVVSDTGLVSWVGRHNL